MKADIRTLLRPGFIVGLVVLLINDHILKQSFPGFITGKLSDVAGLFILPLFMLGLGFRKPLVVYLVTSLGFIWWKSPWSEPFIQLVNFNSFLQIQRVIDYGDLFALLILPLSYLYYLKPGKRIININPGIIVIMSAVAFISTSRAPKRIDVKKTYSFQYPIDTLKHKIFFHPAIWNSQLNTWYQMDTLAMQSDSVNLDNVLKNRDSVFNSFFRDTMTVRLELNNHRNMSACIVPQKNRQLSVMHVLYLQHYLFEQSDSFEDSLIFIFEDKFIGPLYE